MKRDSCVSTNQSAAPVHNNMIYWDFSAIGLQRTACGLQFRSNRLQTAGRMKAFQPFAGIAGAAKPKAGYRKKGIDA